MNENDRLLERARALGPVIREHAEAAERNRRLARPVIDALKGGSLLFAYYPDQNWLRTSKFLKGCAKP